MKVSGVIRAADKGSRGYVLKPFFPRNLSVEIELSGRDVFHNRQMIGGRTQILAQGQNLTAHLAQIVHGLKQFRLSFTQSKHNPTFGDGVRREFFGSPDYLQRSAILCARSYQWRKPL